MQLRVLLTLGIFAFGLGAADAEDVDPDVATVLRGWSLSMPTPASVVVCHGYNCLFRTQVAFSAADHARFAQIMGPGRASAEAERKALGHAEAWFEKRIAPHSGTANAKARSGGRFGVGGDGSQFDCIDTTANTTSLLVVLSKLGLLKHHRVSTPISRLLAGGGPHFSATVEDRKTKKKWTVDPWPHDNGKYPDIMAAERWLDGG
jgi:hypothetical protein